jgi:hypothetical protein
MLPKIIKVSFGGMWKVIRQPGVSKRAKVAILFYLILETARR